MLTRQVTIKAEYYFQVRNTQYGYESAYRQIYPRRFVRHGYLCAPFNRLTWLIKHSFLSERLMASEIQALYNFSHFPSSLTAVGFVHELFMVFASQGKQEAGSNWNQG